MLLLMKAACFLLGHLPLRLSTLIGKALGRLAWLADRRHRSIAIENIERAYGAEMTKREARETARKVFENIAITSMEFMRVPWLKARDLEGYVECEGLENLEKALEKKRGVIGITAHLGNWELLAAYFGLSGFSMDIVIREMDNPLVERFVSWVRTRSGNNMVYKRRAMRQLIRTLSENGVVGILLDQNVTRSEGVFVDFFGTPACTNKGPALLAASSGAPVLPSFIYRTGKTHRAVIGEEIKLSDTGDRNRDAQTNTARFTKAIEEAVRKHPEQWFWVHRRWKTSPR